MFIPLYFPHSSAGSTGLLSLNAHIGQSLSPLYSFWGHPTSLYVIRDARASPCKAVLPFS